jgi:hypothetical protein
MKGGKKVQLTKLYIKTVGVLISLLDITLIFRNVIARPC